MLHHLICWYVKCVEKVPFRKSGHICSTIIYIFSSIYILTVHWLSLGPTQPAAHSLLQH